MHVISQHLALTVWAVKCVTFRPRKHNENLQREVPQIGRADGRVAAFADPVLIRPIVRGWVCAL